jgi:hypothetical protein
MTEALRLATAEGCDWSQTAHRLVGWLLELQLSPAQYLPDHRADQHATAVLERHADSNTAPVGLRPFPYEARQWANEGAEVEAVSGADPNTVIHRGVCVGVMEAPTVLLQRVDGKLVHWALGLVRRRVAASGAETYVGKRRAPAADDDTAVSPAVGQLEHSGAWSEPIGVTRVPDRTNHGWWIGDGPDPERSALLEHPTACPGPSQCEACAAHAMAWMRDQVRGVL